MNGVASVFLLGNITRDPELRYSANGSAIAKFGVAVNRSFTTNGIKKESVTFVDVDCFGKQAETIAEFLKKGSPIFIQGRLTYSEWDDKNGGGKRSKLSVVVESFQFVQSNAEAHKPERETPGTERPKRQPQFDPGNEPDDIPF